MLNTAIVAITPKPSTAVQLVISCTSLLVSRPKREELHEANKDGQPDKPSPAGAPSLPSTGESDAVSMIYRITPRPTSGISPRSAVAAKLLASAAGGPVSCSTSFCSCTNPRKQGFAPTSLRATPFHAATSTRATNPTSASRTRPERDASDAPQPASEAWEVLGQS